MRHELNFTDVREDTLPSIFIGRALLHLNSNQCIDQTVPVAGGQ